MEIRPWAELFMKNLWLTGHTTNLPLVEMITCWNDIGTRSVSFEHVVRTAHVDLEPDQVVFAPKCKARL